MLRFLSYLNIFIAPVYFLVYYQDAVNYFVAAGLIVVIVFSALLIAREDQAVYKKTLGLNAAALLNCTFLLYHAWLVVLFFKAVDFDYLGVRTASFAVFSTVYTVLLFLQLMLYFRKESV